MIELLGVIGGGLLRLFPTVLEFFKQGRDLKYELLRMDKEMELERLRGQLRENEIRAFSEMKVEDNWSTALSNALEAQGKLTGDKWLDRLNVSVRPVMAYWWCIVLYTVYKMILIYVALRDGVSLEHLATVIVTNFDFAVISSIIGFYFVDRAIRRMTGR